MTPAMKPLESTTLEITREIQVRAPIEATFQSLIEQMGPYSELPDGTPMPMKLEAWPGGRWYRDLGGDNGHFWGHVQAIKRPTLLEITGPLFASLPLMSNVQYRLKETDGGTLISFRHTAFGLADDQLRQGVERGWTWILDNIRKRAEGKARTN